jgi:hypothetical protein
VSWLETVLRAGPKSGLRRRLLACARNEFRKNSRVFYTIQSQHDQRRLCGDGTRWPTDPKRAHLGEGVYCWDSRRLAEEYKRKLEPRTTDTLRIVTFRISLKAMQSFSQIDVDALGDPGEDEWFQRYSRLSNENAPAHGFAYVRRGTNMGIEHFFSKTVFHHLRFRKKK